MPALRLHCSVLHLRLCYSRLPCFIRVLHHAAPRCPAPCYSYALYTIHSPFWGQKPVIVLYRGYIKRGCFWPKKRHGKKVPWKLLFFPRNQFWHLPTPHRHKVESGTICFYVQNHGLTLFVSDPRLIFMATMPKSMKGGFLRNPTDLSPGGEASMCH